MLLEIGQALWGETTRVADAIALAPTPTPEPKTINTDGILNFFIQKIVPILLAVLGVDLSFSFHAVWSICNSSSPLPAC